MLADTQTLPAALPLVDVSAVASYVIISYTAFVVLPTFDINRLVVHTPILDGRPIPVCVCAQWYVRILINRIDDHRSRLDMLSPTYSLLVYSHRFLAFGLT